MRYRDFMQLVDNGQRDEVEAYLAGRKMTAARAGKACQCAVSNEDPYMLKVLLPHCPAGSADESIDEDIGEDPVGRAPLRVNLTGYAASLGSDQCLSLLLEHSADPCATADGAVISPIEAAVVGRKPHSVQVLLDKVKNVPLTPLLKRLWAGAGQKNELFAFAKTFNHFPPANPVWIYNAEVDKGSSFSPDDLLDWCIRLLCPAVLGVEAPPNVPLPLPDGLRLSDATLHRNVLMLERLLRREEDFDPADAEAAFGELHFLFLKNHRHLGRIAEAAAALCNRFPELLEKERPRCMLAYLALVAEEDVPEPLKPLLKQLPGTQIKLVRDPYLCWTGKEGGRDDFGDLLSRWCDRIPRLLPCIDRNDPPIETHWEDPAGAVRELLDCCGVTGEVPQGRVSPLTMGLLSTGDRELIRENAHLILQEDADKLLWLAGDPELPRAARKTLVELLL